MAAGRWCGGLGTMRILKDVKGVEITGFLNHEGTKDTKGDSQGWTGCTGCF
jgi:hypothetical protein